jgi:hypothetical protein
MDKHLAIALEARMVGHAFVALEYWPGERFTPFHIQSGYRTLRYARLEEARRDYHALEHPLSRTPL